VSRIISFAKSFWPLAAALVFAGGDGFFVTQALGLGSQQPTQTVTVDIPTGTGAQGPAGPAGPPGPKGDPGSPGAESCPTGYTFSAVVFNSPGGQRTIATCLKN